MMRRALTASIAAIGLLAAGVAIAAWWALGTSSGASTLVRWGLRRALQPSHVAIRRVGGTLARGVVIQSLRIANPAGLPPGTVIQVQRADFRFSLQRLEGLSAQLFNGRLRLPDSAPVVFYGGLADGRLDATVYTPAVNLRHFLDLAADAPELSTVQGSIRDFEARVTGTLRRPTAAGSLQLERLERGPFTLAGCRGVFELTLHGLPARGRPASVHGMTECQSGMVTVKRTTLKLAAGRLTFSGDLSEPVLSARGSVQIGDTSIRMTIHGPVKQPEVSVSSEPPRDTAQLLLMLSTGQSWEKTQEAVKNGELSLGAAREFVSYFVFGSEPRTGFGGVDVNVTYDEAKRGIGSSVQISDKLGVTYGVEQTTPGLGAEESLKHRVGAERKISDNTAVQLEADRQVAPSEVEDNVWLKWKRSF
jgi:hypothetical protein